MSFDYPKREPFFSHRFVRLMAKVCLANEIGPQGCWFLAVIVHTEDAGGYRKPVTFWNGQLMSLAGLGSEDAMEDLRSKCVKAGWLNYRRGARGRSPAYFVVIPEEFEGIDDLPTDEGGQIFTRVFAVNERSISGSNSGQSAVESPVNQRENPRRKSGQSAEPSSLTLSPTLEEIPPNPLPKAKRKSKSPSEPKPREPNPLFDAVAKVTQTDPSVKGSGAKIGAVVSALSGAEIPYTPEEVLRFAAGLERFLPWAFKDRRPPTLNELQGYIGRVRGGEDRFRGPGGDSAASGQPGRIEPPAGKYDNIPVIRIDASKTFANGKPAADAGIPPGDSTGPEEDSP